MISRTDNEIQEFKKHQRMPFLSRHQRMPFLSRCLWPQGKASEQQHTKLTWSFTQSPSLSVQVLDFSCSQSQSLQKTYTSKMHKNEAIPEMRSDDKIGWLFDNAHITLAGKAKQCNYPVMYSMIHGSNTIHIVPPQPCILMVGY